MPISCRLLLRGGAAPAPAVVVASVAVLAGLLARFAVRPRPAAPTRDTRCEAGGGGAEGCLD